jgi:DNA-binding response OmpR family regulator
MELARQRHFRAIILDVMLSRIDGFTVARTLRREGKRTPIPPILLLTARDAISDVIFGLDCGAEDYVVKPFSFLELAAQVRALIHRDQPVQCRLEVGDLVVDTASRQVSRGDTPICLTRTEFQLLEALARQPGRVVGRRELIDAAWGTGIIVDENNLEVMISSLRQRVDRGLDRPMIRTVRGFGCRLEP